MIYSKLNLKAMVQDVLLGDGEVCRLCFGSTEEGRLWLADTVRLELLPYCTPALSLADLLTALTRQPLEEEAGLPECLCLSCANSAIDAYVFQQFMSHSRREWLALHEAVRAAHARAAGERAGHALYIFLGERTAVAWDAARASTAPPSIGEVAKRARRLRLKAGGRGGRGGRVQCEQCGRTFASSTRLAAHDAAHARRLPCAVCRKEFRSLSVLNVHVARVHRRKELPCPDCPKMFSAQMLLTAHRKEMHTYAACRVCGATYTRHALRKHERAHGRRLPCYKCHRQYASKENLRLHQLRCVDGVREKVQCGECGNTYSCKATLTQHHRYAHGDNPLQCQVCGKKYMDKNKLAWHAAEHTGLKSFQCRLCGARFRQANTLMYHTRAKHTGERPYPCATCGEAFITSARRTEHARRRHGAPGPACGACGAAFATAARLRRHRARHHPPAAAPPAPLAPAAAEP